MNEIDSILVATDLTARSDEVIRAAGILTTLAGAKLHAIHFFDFQPLPHSTRALGRVSFQRGMHDARRALREQLRRVILPGAEVGSHVVAFSEEEVINVVQRAILARAEAVGADLVVLGPHAQRLRGEHFLGSTADGVVRAAQVPCLVVRAPLPLPPQRVLVPLDLTEPVMGALDFALGWSYGLRVSGDSSPPAPVVTVLHIIPGALALQHHPVDIEAIGRQLHREVEEAIARTGAAGALDVREEVRWGDVPADEILRSAERSQADLVVLGTHGPGTVKRALLGSVASEVARRATSSVLLVPSALWTAGGAA